VADLFGMLFVTLTMYRMPLVLRQSMSSAFCALPMYRNGAMRVGGEEMMRSRNDGRSSVGCSAASSLSLELRDRRPTSRHGGEYRSLSSSSFALQRFG